MASTRLRKWLKKTDPRDVSRAYSLSRAVQVQLGGAEQVRHHQAIMKAKKLVDANVTNPHVKMFYLSAAERLQRISRNYSGATARQMATAEVLLWMKRGLDPPLLIGIARLFSLEVVIEELMPPAAIAKFRIIPHEGELEITETMVPHVVVEFVSDVVQEVEGRIEISPLGTPDRVRITEYEKLSPLGPWTILNQAEEDVSLIPSQPGNPPTIRLPKKIEKYGYRVEVIAIDIAPRVIRYNFQRLLYE